jgi:hypothetical protein
LLDGRLTLHLFTATSLLRTLPPVGNQDNVARKSTGGVVCLSLAFLVTGSMFAPVRTVHAATRNQAACPWSTRRLTRRVMASHLDTRECGQVFVPEGDNLLNSGQAGQWPFRNLWFAVYVVSFHVWYTSTRLLLSSAWICFGVGNKRHSGSMTRREVRVTNLRVVNDHAEFSSLIPGPFSCQSSGLVTLATRWHRERLATDVASMHLSRCMSPTKVRSEVNGQAFQTSETARTTREEHASRWQGLTGNHSPHIQTE